MNKKIIGVAVLLFASFFSANNVSALTLNENGNYINANGIEMTETQKENLLNLGFTEVQIEAMEREEFDKNKNLKGKVISQKNIYQKNTLVYINPDFIIYSTNIDDNYLIYSEEVTEEEYYSVSVDDNEVMPNGLVNGETITEYKKLTSTIIEVGSRYRLKADMQWRKMPKVRSKDLFTLTMDYWVSVAPGTIVAKQISGYNNICDKITQYKTTNPISGNTTRDGYAAAFQLPKDTDMTCETTYTDSFGVVHPSTPYMPVNIINSYIYYEINPNTSNVVTINAYADYAHGTKTITFNPIMELSLTNEEIGISISINPKYEDSFDSMNTAHAALTGANWN